MGPDLLPGRESPENKCVPRGHGRNQLLDSLTAFDAGRGGSGPDAEWSGRARGCQDGFSARDARRAVEKIVGAIK